MKKTYPKILKNSIIQKNDQPIQIPNFIKIKITTLDVVLVKNKCQVIGDKFVTLELFNIRNIISIFSNIFEYPLNL